MRQPEPEGRAVRRRSIEAAGGIRADPRSGRPSFTLAVTAPPAGLRLTNDPSRSIVEPRNGGCLGGVG